MKYGNWEFRNFLDCISVYVIVKELENRDILKNCSFEVVRINSSFSGSNLGWVGLERIFM